MPRATNAIDPVLKYFRTAPISDAELTLYVVKDIVKGRKPLAEKKVVRKARTSATPNADTTPAGS